MDGQNILQEARVLSVTPPWHRAEGLKIVLRFNTPDGDVDYLIDRKSIAKLAEAMVAALISDI